MSDALFESVFEAMLHRARDYCLVLDDSRHVLAASDSFLDVFAQGRNIRGARFDDLLDSGSRGKARAFLNALADQTCAVELNHAMPDGPPRLVSYSFFRVDGPDGATGIAALGRDQEASLELVESVVRLNSELEEAHRLLAEQAVTDALTGLGNRRWLFERLDALWADSIRQAAPCWLMMVDIDHFKSINDTHGHQAGDEVLVAVAQSLRDSVRRADLVARFGGEEFCLAGAGGPDVAEALADRILESIRSLRVAISGRELHVTASLGVAVVWPLEDGSEVDSVLQTADAALYRAKSGGRDRVEVAEPCGMG